MSDRKDVPATPTAAGAAAPPPAADATTAPAIRRGFLDRPGCRVYFEATGSGPGLVFAHGLGSNHLTWWQQVPHFASRCTCVTFAHRGYPPGSAIPGGPDPRDFPGDLAALIDHLHLADVRLVAQSMGGWSCLEYALASPHRVRALVLAATAGTIAWPSIPLADRERLTAWSRQAEAARGDMQRRAIAPPAGERMAREHPALHFLYREIANVSDAVDREALRQRLVATATRPAEVLRTLPVPTLFIVGDEDTTYAPLLSDALAPLMPNARVEHIREAGHSVYFQKASVFNNLVDRFLGAVGQP
jgi:pimeloyl-ACP methyl ester carboxylesterase